MGRWSWRRGRGGKGGWKQGNQILKNVNEREIIKKHKAPVPEGTAVYANPSWAAPFGSPFLPSSVPL